MNRLKLGRIIYCFLTVTVIMSLAAGSAYALDPKQKTLEGIGSDIAWYDFGDTYTSYYINDDQGTGFYALTMSDGKTTSKTGFVNAKGEIVLAPVLCDGYSSSFDGGKGLFTIKTPDNHFYYIDSDGVKEIAGNAYLEIGSFQNGYATVTLKSNNHKGVVDKNGSLIFEDKEGRYQEFRYLGSGVFSAETSERNYDFVDFTGALLTKSHYTNEWLRDVSEETISVSKDGKYGYLDLTGNEIVPAVYDDAYPFSDGLAAVCRNGKWGYVDKTGKEVIATGLDAVTPFGGSLAAVSANGKWGLIDKEGKVVLPIEYDSVTGSENGNFVANKDNQAILLDASGKIVSAEDYSYIYMDPNGLINVGKTLNGLDVRAYMDKNEAMLTGWKEYYLMHLSDQLYLGIKRGEYPPGIVPPHDYSQRFALLDSDGNNLTGFKYSNAGGFFNNFQVVNRYYYGTAGLVNQYGAEVLPTIFDDILLTNKGYAFVTISDETSGTSRVGYFKIPERFSGITNARPITVYLNGIELYFDSGPVIRNQTTMVPVRKIFEALGSSIKWDGSTKTVTAIGNDKSISLTIGSDIASVNGSKTQLEASPFIQDNTTFVPLRFLSENLGAEVKWDNDLRRVSITSNK